MLEHVLEALEKRLLSVLEPAVPQGAAGTQSAPAHPVPLANTLHVVADRVGSLVDKAESLLNRLHV
ncbi:hypothetical protein DIE01_16215 [Burkholderia sp. Bp8990]|nr:hypothetical protein DIE01_16215 [Burkholderia sp. Bp8990]